MKRYILFGGDEYEYSLGVQGIYAYADTLEEAILKVDKSFSDTQIVDKETMVCVKYFISTGRGQVTESLKYLEHANYYNGYLK